MEKEKLTCLPDDLLKEKSADLKVLIMLYWITKVEQEPCWFTKMVERTGLSRSEVSKAQDKLDDLGLIYEKYEAIGKTYTNCWHLEDEAEEFIKGLTDHFGIKKIGK